MIIINIASLPLVLSDKIIDLNVLICKKNGET
jgi:hypothetical protein